MLTFRKASSAITKNVNSFLKALEQLNHSSMNYVIHILMTVDDVYMLRRTYIRGLVIQKN